MIPMDLEQKLLGQDSRSTSCLERNVLELESLFTFEPSGTLVRSRDGCRIPEVGWKVERELLGGNPWIATAAAHKGAVASGAASC